MQFMDQHVWNCLAQGMEVDKTVLISVPTYLKLHPSVNEQNTQNIANWVEKYLEVKNADIKLLALASTAKSQVYKIIINNLRTYVYKHFSIPSHFYKELFALNLFQNENFVPRLIDADEQFHFLIIEYVAYDPQLKHEEFLNQIACNLGRLHSYAQSELLPNLFPKRSLGNFIETLDSKITGIFDKEMLVKALEIGIEFYGDSFPIHLGEFMPHHVLLTAQKCMFVDLDLFSVGFPDYFDLFGFFIFNQDLFNLEKDPWKKLLKSYLEGKFQREIPKTEIDLNYDILSLMTKALGGPHNMIPTDIFKIGGYVNFTF